MELNDRRQNGWAWKGFRTNRARKRRQMPGRPPTARQCRRLACRLCGTTRLAGDADRARSILTRSPTPLGNKVASLFGSRAPLCNERAGNTAPACRNDRGLTAASSPHSRWQSIFPTSRARCRSSSSPSQFLTINKYHGRCVRHCRNVRGLDTFWSVGL
jgi:hypothetical protein